MTPFESVSFNNYKASIYTQLQVNQSFQTSIEVFITCAKNDKICAKKYNKRDVYENVYKKNP